MADPSLVEVHSFQTTEFAQTFVEKGMVNFHPGQPSTLSQRELLAMVVTNHGVLVVARL